MKAPVPHPQEAGRLRALEETGLAGTPAEQRFDVIIETARRTFNVPIALFSLVTADQQCFKSAAGISEPHTPRDISFCGHTILTPDLFVIEDALKDVRFADNPLVTSEPNIRFYAGCPIYGALDLPIGTLCLIDRKPRHLDVFEKRQLRALGQWLNTEVRNRGLSETEIHALGKDSVSLRQFLDEVAKCWNEHATEPLLSNTMNTARPGQVIAACLFDFQFRENIDQPTKRELQDTRFELGNRIRRALPEDAILTTLGPHRFLAILPDLAGRDPDRLVSEAAQVLETAPSLPIPMVWRGMLLVGLPHDGRLKRDALSALEHAITSVQPLQFTIQHGDPLPTGTTATSD